MQPIDIVERVKTTYKNYIKTSFPVIDENLRAQMHARIDQANLLCRSCGHWHAPTNRTNFEDHKLLHNRRQPCGGNSERYALGYRFHTDILIFHFQDVPQDSDEFYASLKAAVIEAANSVVHAEAGEISGFTRTVQRDGEILVLYDSVPGGAGYVRKVAANLKTVLAVARTMLDGCQCEKSCYKCLRSYENQFEHKLLDKRLIQPYLDHLLVLNSEEEKTRLTRYGNSSQRFCGSTPSAWLQRRWRAVGGSLVGICAVIDNSDIPQATPWAKFLVRYAQDHPEIQIELGLTQLPRLTEMTEENFSAVKALLDLLEAGVRLFHIPHATANEWQMVFGLGCKELLAVATLDELPMLSTELETQALVYNAEGATCHAAIENIREMLQHGTPVNIASLKLPAQDSHQVVEIEDGQCGVTYEALFRQHLAGAKHIRMIDPYVRQEYQVRNVEDFLNAVGCQSGCHVELVTMYEKNDRYGLSEEQTARQRLEALKERLAKKGLEFSYSFDPQIHDRLIETDKWQIILGRGLDFYYPPEPGQPRTPEMRRAKKCQIIFLPK